MNLHHQPEHTFQIDNRLVTMGAVLTAAGALLSGAGMAVMAFAAVKAGKRMIRNMDVPPSQQAAMKWQKAKEASRAGMDAWHSASDA
ncbi:hypothetical protein [Streptomyces canus]|uniref:hypothetical protein n=1 Tax=Streptomyces canus TaxID=58343 RepID=UPI00038089CB|nr:hypothetical protein [Streptomyces canus]